MSELVEAPEGKGRIAAAAEVPGDWRVQVELSGGGTWTGLASDGVKVPPELKDGGRS